MRAGSKAHLSTNRLAAPDVDAKVQRLTRPTPLPLAVFLGVEQRFAHYLPLLHIQRGKSRTGVGDHFETYLLQDWSWTNVGMLVDLVQPQGNDRIFNKILVAKPNRPAKLRQRAERTLD